MGATGYTSQPFPSSDALRCKKPNDVPVNAIASAGGFMRGMLMGAAAPVRTGAFLAADDLAWEAWIRPKANGLTYGATDAGPGPVADTHQCPIGFTGSFQFAVFVYVKDGAGLGVGYYSSTDALVEVEQGAMSGDMERWWHIAGQLDRTNAELQCWIDGVPLAAVAITSNGGPNLVQWEVNPPLYRGITNMTSCPSLGAFAFHNRLLTHVEVQNSVRTGTVNVLGAGATEYAYDWRDVYLNGGPNWTVETAGDVGADLYLGDAAIGEDSEITFKGTTQDWGNNIVAAIVPDLSPNRRDSLSVENGNSGSRFAFFDGR